MGDEREPEGLKRIEVYASPEPIIEGVKGLARELVADIEKHMRDRFSEVKSEIKGMRRIDPQDRDAIVEGVVIQLRPVLAKAIAHGSVAPVALMQSHFDPEPKRWRSDAPPQLIKHQLEVCARELGDAIVEMLPGLALHSVRRLLQGAPEIPRTEPDTLDRLYVIVRMLQLDIDHASVDVEQVQSIIRRNQKLRLSAIATQQNGDG